MHIEYRNYDKKSAFQHGISLTSQPCIFTNSAKASEMRGLMSCGHAVECMNLYSYFYHSVLHDRYEIRCPALLSENPRDLCRKRWNYDELRRMCLLTPQDCDFFEMALNINRINAEGNVKRCPKCSNFVKKNENSTWVFCQSCNIIDPNNSYYCFECGLERPEKLKKGQSTFVCESEQCTVADNLLFDIPKKKIGGSWVNSFKKCPNCKIWIEHSGTSYCKIITCACNHRFCFVCGKGGNSNSFLDCSTVEGGCGRSEELEKLLPQPIKKERPAPQYIAPPTPASKQKEEEGSMEHSRPRVVSKRDARVEEHKPANLAPTRQPLKKDPPKKLNQTESDAEIAKPTTESHEITEERGSLW